jgi:hypothetical protein
MDRTRYRQELNRETYLQIAGYRVVAVAYDDLESTPELTVSLFRALLGPCMLGNGVEGERQYTRLERDILRMGACWNGPIRPIDLINGLNVSPRTIRKSMKQLCEQGKFRPGPTGLGSKRVCRYEYIHSFADHEIW